LLSSVRPRAAVGKARKQLALDYLAEVERLDAKLKTMKKQIAELVDEQHTSLVEVFGIGKLGAGKILAEVLDVRRFPSKDHFASYTGTAPIDVSSGDNEQRTAPAQPRRQPAPQPRAARRRDLPDPTTRPRPGLLPTQTRRRQDPPRGTALPQTATVQRVYQCLIEDLAVQSPGGQVGASVQFSASPP
jgi:transposase